MLNKIAVVAILSASANAIIPELKAPVPYGLCAKFFPQNKNQKTANDIDVCSSTVGSFHYICGSYKYDDAAQICAANGWRLAMVDEGNQADAFQLVKNCQVTPGPAWIGGYNGLAANPCAAVLNRQRLRLEAVLNIGILNCQVAQLNIVCQDIPQYTQTITIVQSTTVGLGTSTAVVTTVRHRHWCPCSSSSSSSSSQYCHHCSCNCSWSCNKAKDPKCVPCPPEAKGHQEKAQHSRPHGNRHGNHHYGNHHDHTCKPDYHGTVCSPVCPAQVGNIRLVQKAVDASQSALECAKHGWFPLDMTTGLEADIAHLLDECSVPEGQAWINSFNGVGSNCTFAGALNVLQRDNIVAFFSAGGDVCAAEKYVLCQDACPQETGLGQDVGLVSVSMTTLSTTNTVYTPTTTITITSTIFDKKNN